MGRDKKHLPRKTAARKTTPHGIEDQSENIGDSGREDFNLRTDNRDIVLGRAAARDAPDSVHGAISRHKEQARRFTEHAAKPIDGQQPETGCEDLPVTDTARDTLPTIDAEGLPPTVQSPIIPSRFVTESEPHIKVDTAARHKSKPAYQEHFAKLQADEAGNSSVVDNQPMEPQMDAIHIPDLSAEPPAQANRNAQTHDVSLSHAHTPRSMSKRPGRLRYGGLPPTQKKTPRQKPGSPDAAKYIPPGEVTVGSEDTQNRKQSQVDVSPDTVKSTQPDAVKSGRDGSSSGTPRYKTQSAGKLRHESADTLGSKDADTPREKPRRKPESPDSDTKPADGEQPTADTSVGEREKPSTAQASGKGKNTGANQGSTRSHADKSGKLQFTENETPPTADTSPSDKKPPGRKLEKARHKAERSGRKLDKARKNLPKKHSVKVVRTVDEKSGKVKKKLRFEEEVKSQHEHLKGPLVTRPVKAGVNAVIVNAHRKIFQVEHENVGTQAAHKGEMLAEGGLRTAYRMHKTSPYRRVEKLERRTTKLNIKASYQQALNDNPKLMSNILSRMAQKRNIKKDYAKAARESKKTAQRAKKTGDVIGRAGQDVVRVATRHPVMLGTIAALFLLVVIISSLFTSCSNMATGIGSGIIAMSYLAEDADVDNAELYYTELETDLQMQIGRAETNYAGYDEYRYQIGDIGHNPYELMAYLTVMYQDFRYTDVETVLWQIFAEQYQLTFTPSVEIRYADPTDANEDGDYEPYDWHVMTITLTSRSFTDVIFSRMNTEQQQQYSLLMRSKGNRQYAGSPLSFNWLHYVTSYYGYRIHPTTGVKDYHMGIDIGVPIGTDVHAAHGGTVSIGYDAGGYGRYITLTCADGLVTKYAHLDSVLVSDGQTVTAGDVIAKSGNSGNSTGPHLHFEVIKNGQYLNPIYFSLTNDNGSVPIYGYAGEPMGDGSYEALIAEAEKYLGYPYVWGGSSPATSFDCSGYVSWCINQSGVGSVGRQTAQGLYNLCSPVSPADAKPGDLIFFTGTYSAATPVTHVGIYVGGGQMIHCGNPIQYTSINTSYWQSHFYSFGRLN